MLSGDPSVPMSGKVSDKMHKAEAEGRNYWAFEFFPPKTEQGKQNLYERFGRMAKLNPQYIDVTWNAGGTSSDTTMEVCSVAQTKYGLETCMHLTCTNMPKQKIDDALKQAKSVGIQNILALRGDPPHGQDKWSAVEGGFSYASDLIRYIREQYGDYFCIGVAGYPETHRECESEEKDLAYLKEKLDAGADYVITQLFYDANVFLTWYQKARAIGITAPIVPGIMIVQSYGGFKRMTEFEGTTIPPPMAKRLEAIKDDDKAVKDYGVEQAVDMCNELIQAGIKGFHFYTMNMETSTQRVLEGLNFI